ncbi:MAG: pilus assembly protein TadB [Acidobacteria bacterium]|nr:pilus assembly protein TadB [Acidobacteriota bacterium]
MAPLGYLLIFGLTFLVVGAAVVLAWLFLDRRPGDESEPSPHILQADALSAIGLLALVLERVKLGERLKKMIQEANLGWSAGRVILLTLTTFALTFAVLLRTSFVPWWAALIVAAGAGSAPIVRIRQKRAQRLAAVEAQLPEALDFISRALVAGHSLPMSLELLADEIGQPMASELRKTVDEYNLGLSMEQALMNLSERVPSVDIQFFASAIVTQSRTGGNLHDLLENLAETIRERATLKGQVQALTANGRMTAIVLSALPFVLAGAMMMVNPDFFMVLVRNPTGKTLLFLAFIAQVAAFFVIRKIADIRI